MVYRPVATQTRRQFGAEPGEWPASNSRPPQPGAPVRIALTASAATLKRPFTTRAQMAELVDALASGASDRKVVEVRVLFWAPQLLCAAKQHRAAREAMGGSCSERTMRALTVLVSSLYLHHFLLAYRLRLLEASLVRGCPLTCSIAPIPSSFSRSAMGRAGAGTLGLRSEISRQPARRLRIQTKNTPPISPVTMPIGISSGAMTVRAMISAHIR